MNVSVSRLLAAALLVAAGCTTTAPVRIEDPVTEIFTSLKARITLLNDTKANREQWTKSAQGSSRISTVSQLQEALKYFGIPTDESERRLRDEYLPKLLRESHDAFHFWWDFDLSVIVFFDAKGRQKYAYPFESDKGAHGY